MLLLTVSVGAQEPEVIAGEANADFGRAVVVHDLDGDGKAEIIVTAPRHNIGRKPAVGQVVIVRGGVKPENEGRLRKWTGVTTSRFGASCAVGDINGDGHPDLLVGSPDTARMIGACQVILGGKNGGNLLHGGSVKNAALTISAVTPSGQFGTSCALGDIDGDGLADLVVSQPHATVGSTPRAGRVLVFRGRRRWKEAAYSVGDGKQQTLRPDLIIVGREKETLGTRVLVQDLDGDGAGDIIIGSPWYMGGRGSVVVVKGATGTLKKPRTIVLDKDDVALVVHGNRAGHLGQRIAATDLDGDGLPEILMSEPHRDSGRTKEAGAVHALIWDPSVKRLDLGLSRETKGLTTLRGVVAYERLGGGLSLGDIGGETQPDLLVGSPDVGRVVWFTDPGPFAKKLRPTGYKMATGSGERLFGAAIAVGDLDGSGTPRLVVGAPGSSKIFIYPLQK